MRRRCFVLKGLRILQHRFSTLLSLFLVSQGFHRSVGFAGDVESRFHKVGWLSSFSVAKVLPDFTQIPWFSFVPLQR